MEKVYFDKDFYGSWVVKDLSDFYDFKYIHRSDDGVKSTILNWTKDTTAEEELKPKWGNKPAIRLYVAEIEDRKFHFVLRYEEDFGKFLVSPATAEDVYEMDKLFKETGYIFVGETLKEE